MLSILCFILLFTKYFSQVGFGSFIFFFLIKKISILGRAGDPSSTHWRMKEKKNIRELKCCHLVFEIVNSNWKILTLSQTHKHMLQYLAVCFRGCVAFAYLFNRSIHKITVIFKNNFSFVFFTVLRIICCTLSYKYRPLTFWKKQAYILLNYIWKKYILKVEFHFSLWYQGYSLLLLNSLLL